MTCVNCLKINHIPHLLAVRVMQSFPRLSGLYDSKDVWFLYGLRVPYRSLKKISLGATDGEVQSIQVQSICALNAQWLTQDLITIIKQDKPLDQKHGQVYGVTNGFVISNN